MSITAQDLLAWAEQVSTRSPLQEVDARACISRAYYASFHHCRDWHARWPAPGTFGTGYQPMGTHATLIAQLANPTQIPEPDKLKSRRRGHMLRALRVMRVQADYELNAPLNAESVQKALQDAKKIFSVL